MRRTSTAKVIPASAAIAAATSVGAAYATGAQMGQSQTSAASTSSSVQDLRAQGPNGHQLAAEARTGRDAHPA